jgi:hypothetical protein
LSYKYKKNALSPEGKRASEILDRLGFAKEIFLTLPSVLLTAYAARLPICETIPLLPCPVLSYQTKVELDPSITSGSFEFVLLAWLFEILPNASPGENDAAPP